MLSSRNSGEKRVPKGMACDACAVSVAFAVKASHRPLAAGSNQTKSAKSENMPQDNIQRAIQRGTGELPGATYEEFSLEGYGPGGVAILLDINTDNRNRTVSEIRHAFGKNGGNMAEAGAVSWMFHKKGDIVIPKTAAKEDDLMSIVLEAGADDLRDDGENWEVLTDTSVFEAVTEAVKKAGIAPASSSV